MKHYQHPTTGELYAYEEDGSQDAIIPADLAPVTQEQADAIRAALNPTSSSRAQQIVEIEAHRDAALASGVVHDGVRYHADLTFLTELMGRIMGYQIGLRTGALPIRTKDNQTLMLDQAQHVALAAAVGAYRESVYAASWAEKDALP